MSKAVRTVRIEDDVWQAAERVASVTYRSTAALVGYALELYLRKHYPAAFDPQAHVTLVLDEAPEKEKQWKTQE